MDASTDMGRPLVVHMERRLPVMERHPEERTDLAVQAGQSMIPVEQLDMSSQVLVLPWGKFVNQYYTLHDSAIAAL